jgi:hypothetical protein
VIDSITDTDTDAVDQSAGSANPSYFEYSVAGLKTIRAKGHGQNSGLPCNGGTTLQQNFNVGAGLATCSAKVTLPDGTSGPATVGQAITATAQIGAQGTPAYTLNVTVDDLTGAAIYQATGISGSSSQFTFNATSGATYKVILQVTDSMGSTATCSTYQVYK